MRLNVKATPIVFPVGEGLVVHNKSGNLYRVIATPETSLVQINGVWFPAYRYEKEDASSDNPSLEFIRSQQDFEASFSSQNRSDI